MKLKYLITEAKKTPVVIWSKRDSFTAFKLDGCDEHTREFDMWQKKKAFEQSEGIKKVWLDTKRKKYSPAIKKFVKEYNPSEFYCGYAHAEDDPHYHNDSIVVEYKE